MIPLEGDVEVNLQAKPPIWTEVRDYKEIGY